MDTEFQVIELADFLDNHSSARQKKLAVPVSKKSDLVALLFQHFHEASLHGGGQLTLNLESDGSNGSRMPNHWWFSS